MESNFVFYCKFTMIFGQKMDQSPYCCIVLAKIL